VVERGAASKGGCSHDWLPHIADWKALMCIGLSS